MAMKNLWSAFWLVTEIIAVHSSIVLSWKFLWPYLFPYLPDFQPLLHFVWINVLEPYAVLLFSVPSAVASLTILCYIAAKKLIPDIFNAEGMLD